MSPETNLIQISYFPGCSLATSAKENNESLKTFCRAIGYELVELDDWNCCGTSSAHSIDSELALGLASRNLFIAPPHRPLLVACPSCMLRLTQAHHHLTNNPTDRHYYEEYWGRLFNPQLELIHFFELLNETNLTPHIARNGQSLNGLTFVPYYGCMLNHPPGLRHRYRDYYGRMEAVLSRLGAEARQWAYPAQCCGTFLSVVRPDVVTPMVNRIVQGAVDVGADCIITACAMCHMNLEVRCNLKQRIPIFHFSEILSLALGVKENGKWFKRHLEDPIPLLRQKGLMD